MQEKKRPICMSTSNERSTTFSFRDLNVCVYYLDPQRSPANSDHVYANHNCDDRLKRIVPYATTSEQQHFQAVMIRTTGSIITVIITGICIRPVSVVAIEMVRISVRICRSVRLAVTVARVARVVVVFVKMSTAVVMPMSLHICISTSRAEN